MKTTCSICKKPLFLDVYEGRLEGVFHCEYCDRSPKKNVLGGLLDAIKKKKEALKDGMGADLLAKLWLARKKKEIEENIDEITIQYYCIKCQRPTNQYGYCLWCEDGLRETL